MCLENHFSKIYTQNLSSSFFFVEQNIFIFPQLNNSIHIAQDFLSLTTMSLSMSTTTSGHYSALSLPTRTNSKQNQPYFLPTTKLFSSRNSFSCSFSNTLLSKPFLYVVKASSDVGSEASKEESEKGEGGEEEPYEEYEVEIDQPYGIKFVKGRDGGTYIDAIAPGGSADKAGVFTVGDKVLATSAVFGTEIWPAAEYGRTMYTIRQRIGPLLMRMQKRYGKIETGGALTEKEIIRAERNSGVVSSRLREIQMQNYLRKKELKAGREQDLREGLLLYKNAKYEEALEKFESVLGSKPEPEEAAVASYNVACCYSKLNQIKAALSSLEEALKSGFEDFKRIRTDPDLANARASPEFDPLLKRFDESFINESAINAIKSIFGFNKN
ncbi:protein MET1, chloroplastic [Trifolium pratense]|uniref:protein MET1, chloroplastic n=1 Tax=Trifolium pratense TaxID=57577 RepID=UPI001E693B08|nr:protein MET1, chloroplastic [Trifolium pratense]